MNLVLLGKPGAGKGYISTYLEEKYGFKHMSTGDICRKNIKKRTENGILAEEYCKTGQLVPLNIILQMLKQEIEQDKNDNVSYIFDGFPRNVAQAKELEKITTIDAVILIDVPNETILKRISNRRICPKCSKMYNTIEAPNGKCLTCGTELTTRADDNLDVAQKRLDIYEKETKPLIDFYKNQLLIVDNSGNIDKTLNELNSKIERMLKKTGEKI